MTDLQYSPSTLTVFVSTDMSTVRNAWLMSKPSKRTREAYSYDLAKFEQFLFDHQAGTVGEATRQHIDGYARDLAQRGYNPASQARYIASVSSFYRYACQAGQLKANPAQYVARPKIDPYSTRLGLDLDTAPPVIAAARELGGSYAGIVALCLCTGLRVSEAIAVTKEATENYQAGHRVLTVLGKGGAIGQIPLSPLALDLLDQVLTTTHSGILLKSKAGTPLSRFQVFYMVKVIGEKAKLGRPLTPHDLRHGAATCAIEAGLDINRVQDLLRHSSPVTTQRYIHARDRLDKSAAYGLSEALGQV